METQDRLPINILFEIVQDAAPNDHWYHVTPVLSWEAAHFVQRMDTSLCLGSEVEENKEAVCFLIGTHFDIQETCENRSQEVR